MSSRMEAPAAEPRTVDEARGAVERSRERMSSTLDALEDRIVEKKHALQQKADIVRPLRERVMRHPFTAVAVAVGIGALLGSLGGTDSDRGSHRSDRGSRRDRDGYLNSADRAELRDYRKHRRERLNALRSARHDEEDSGPSRMDSMKHQLMGALTAAIGAAVTAKVKDLAGISRNGRTR